MSTLEVLQNQRMESPTYNPLELELAVSRTMIRCGKCSAALNGYLTVSASMRGKTCYNVAPASRLISVLRPAALAPSWQGAIRVVMSHRTLELTTVKTPLITHTSPGLYLRARAHNAHLNAGWLSAYRARMCQR